MHRKRPAFLTDMGLLMFLAVTASLLGYCQTDERGKTQRRDSRPPFFFCSPYPFLSYLSSTRPHLAYLPPAASKEIRISLSASSNSGGGRENSAVREKERRRLTFMAAGMSSSREFTYSESGLMVAAHIHRQALLIVRETSTLHPARRPFVNTPARTIISGAPRVSRLIREQ